MLPTIVKINLHTLYWLLAFFQGVMMLIGLPTTLYKVGMPLILILLLLDQIKNRDDNFTAKGLVIYLFLILVSIMSGLFNNIDSFSIIYFIRYISLHYLYYLILINEHNKRIFTRVFRVIIILFLIQLPAALIKLFTIGVAEEVIGTINLLSGSLSTTIPVFVSIYLLVWWLDKKKLVYLVLILFFLGFGLIGGKRAIIYILPLFLLFTYTFYLYFSESRKKITLIYKVVPLSLLVILIFYLTARINPSLNPEDKVWGSFDYNHVISYTEEYSTNEKVRIVGDIPRIEAWGYFWLLQSNKGLSTVLLGDGAGKLIVSYFNENAGDNPMITYYDTFYGGRMGAMWLFLQIGLVGLLLYFALYFKIFRDTLRTNLKPEEKTILYSTTLLLLFDSLYYSKTFIYYQVLIGVFFTYMAYLKMKKVWN